MVNKKYHPWIGGVEKVAQDICEGLKDRVDFTVLVGNDTNTTVKEEVNGVKVIRAATIKTISNTPICPSMPGLIKKHPSDICHFHFPYPWGDVSYLMASPKAKLVVTYHSDIIRQKNLNKIYKPVMRRFLGRADAIIATSPNMIKNSPVLSRLKQKCVVIPLCTDISRFEQRDESKIDALKSEYGPKILLFVGRLIYYKGLQYLIKAMTKIEANLLLVGEGPLKEELLNLAKELKVDSKVFFLGPKTDDELPALYQAADIFILPSIEKTEAFGIVQLEAMASGTPVICTNLKTGVPYVNKDRETGFVVPPQDSEAIARASNDILNNDELRASMSLNASKRVNAEFTKELFLDRHFDLYRSLLK